MPNKKTELKYIVGLGASAGGLEALQEFFGSLPKKLNMAFIVVQHLSPDFESLMNELLLKYTGFTIITPTKKTIVKANHIYLISKSKNLIFENGYVMPVDKDPTYKLNLPIDIFFQTLGENAKDKSIGIILSGTGTDGSRGIKSIKENGGLVMIQTPDSAKFDGMPKSSMKLGISDLVKTPKEIGLVLSELESQDFNEINVDLEKDHSSENPFFNEILQLLKEQFNIDFRLYRKETLLRRTQKRMQVANCRNLKEYFNFLKNSYEEVSLLQSDFLIGVTKFFRDAPAWQKIKSKIIPDLIKSAGNTGTLRVWSVGCSTGEEAYSIAILLEEGIKKTNNPITYKIFATDASKLAIDFASKGVYNDNIAVDMNSSYLFEYFTKKDYSYQIKKNVREKIIFSQHNALSDPPIIGVDLIICRNMLIYIKPEMQKLMLNNFQFALNFKGFLFLGISENVSSLEQVFTSVDSNYKIFQSTLKRKLIPQTKIGPASFDVLDPKSRGFKYFKPEIEISNERIFQNLMLESLQKVNLFVSEDFDILYSLGDIDKFLTIPVGILNRFNLLEMVGKKESLLFRNGVRIALKDNKKVSYNEIPITKKNNILFADAIFIPKWLEEYNKKVVLIEIFESKGAADPTEKIKKIKVSNLDSEHVNLLETEIKELRYELQKSKEELEASNEELQASNEELLGANEELQSSNEELQSVNEELYAVNNEFQIKIQELSRLNDDISNLFQNLDSAVIYLDKNLNIRKLTPKAEELFHFTNNDVGRSITHFSNWLEDDIFYSNVKKCINKLESIEYQHIQSSGKVYLIRIVPYKTSDNVIDGVIITLVDVGDMYETKRQLEIQQKMVSEAGKVAKIGSWELDLKSEIFTSIEYFYKLLGYDSSKKLKLREFIKFFHPDFKDIIEYSFDNIENENFDIQVVAINKKVIRLKAGIIYENSSQPKASGIIQDITSETELNSRYKQILDTSIDGFFALETTTGKFIEVNDSFCKLTGYTKNELLSKYIWDIDTNETQKDSEKRIKEIIEKGSANFESKHKRKDGTLYEALIKVKYNNLFPNLLTVFVEDITNRKIWEKELQLKNDELRKINQELDTFVYRTSHDLRAPLASSIGLIELLKLETNKSVQVEELINMQEKALNSMDDFIRDILTYSRNIRLETKTEKIDLKTDIKEVLERLAHVPNFTQVSKEIEFGCNFPFYSDHFRLNIILNNLISNALKFSDLSKPNPFLKIKITCDEKEVEIIITDNGIGIEKEHLAKVFEIFYRATQTVEGTGVGLFIVKDSVDKLNGTIDLKSKPGEGTRFIVKIPNKKSKIDN